MGSQRQCPPRPLCHRQAKFGACVSPSLFSFPPNQAFVTGFPDETSLEMEIRNEMLPLAAAATGSHGTAAMSEQPAAGEDASDTSLHGGCSLQLPDSLTGSSWSHGEVPLTPLSLQGLAWQACSRMSSNCWWRSCRHHGSSRHYWRAWPTTQPPTSTTSPTALSRWARPCTNSCSVRRPILAPLATESPMCPFLRVALECPPRASPDDKEKPQLSPCARCIPP